MEKMVFNSRLFPEQPDSCVAKSRFSEVELAVAFRQLSCHQCSYTAIYKYRVQQVRRRPEIEISEGEEVRPDHEEIWRTVPRFAEIPETIKCKRCNEVLGLYTLCIF